MMDKVFLKLAAIAGLSGFALFAAPGAAVAQSYTSPAPRPTEFGPAPDAGVVTLHGFQDFLTVADVGFSSVVTADGNIHTLRRFYFGSPNDFFAFDAQVNCGERLWRYATLVHYKNGQSSAISDPAGWTQIAEYELPEVREAMIRSCEIAARDHGIALR